MRTIDQSTPRFGSTCVQPPYAAEYHCIARNLDGYSVLAKFSNSV